MLRSLYLNRHLIYRLTVREIAGKYKGSAFGLAWSFINPILMLAVYTYVFSYIFKTRWVADGAEQNKTLFALLLFVGMIIHGLFAEVLNRAPSLILSNVNYVKRVVFPVEILAAVSLTSAFFHTAISFFVLLAAYLVFNGSLHFTVIYLPAILFPLVVLCLATGWVVSSLGVFVRDIGQTTALLSTVLLFLSPVFYPVSSLPESFQFWMYLNPLTFVIEQARDVLIWGRQPNWSGIAGFSVGSLFIAWLAFAWFQKVRTGFADVL